MNKIWNYALMAVLTVGLSFAATSCKDDDDNSGNNGNGTETVDDPTSLEEYQLRLVIANFAGIDPDDVVLTKTYEPEIGVVDDESKPNVRSIAVGTVEKADEAAAMLLSSLDIDATSPAGFSYSSDMVGTVSYQHGGGDANTLATINLELKQMPGLVQLRLTKTAGENANTLPRYKVGDIVKYKNHYWVCVFEAPGYRSNAYFVTFDHTGDLHKTSTFTWTPSYSDKYWQYSTPMAEDTYLSLWLINCVINDNGWNKVKNNFKFAKQMNLGLDEEDLDNLIPATAQKRLDFVKTFFTPEPDEEEGFVTYMVSKEQTNEWYAEGEADRVATYDNGKGQLKAPVELLCNTTRYSENVRSNNQFWVPYLFMCPKSKVTAFDEYLKAIPSQNAKKFKYQILHPSIHFNSPELKELLGTDDIGMMTAARYWEHEYFNGKNWLLFDFSYKHSDKPEDKWTSRCITSKSMYIVDKGVTASGFTDIYVGREDDLHNNYEDDLNNNIANVKVGNIIACDGKVYDTRDEAITEGNGVAAVIVYLGGNKRVETGKDWNGLAIATSNVVRARWNDSGYEDTCPNLPSYANIKDAQSAYNGFQVTNILTNDCKEQGHKHPVVDALSLVNRKVNTRDGDISSWFVPSLGQWNLAMQGLGGTLENGTVVITKDQLAAVNLEFLFTTEGMWTTSSADENNAYLLPFNTNAPDVIRSTPRSEQKSTTHPTIGFIAFRYGNGGTQEP